MTLDEVISTIEIAVAEVEWNYPLNYAIAFEEAISALKEKQERGRNNMEWISVKDRLPDEEDDVLLLVREVEHYGRHGEERAVYRWIFTGWRIDDEWATTYCHGHRKLDDENESFPNCQHTVTHWMPLPAPPKEVE